MGNVVGLLFTSDSLPLAAEICCVVTDAAVRLLQQLLVASSSAAEVVESTPHAFRSLTLMARAIRPLAKAAGTASAGVRRALEQHLLGEGMLLSWLSGIQALSGGSEEEDDCIWILLQLSSNLLLAGQLPDPADGGEGGVEPTLVADPILACQVRTLCTLLLKPQNATWVLSLRWRASS